MSPKTSPNTGSNALRIIFAVEAVANLVGAYSMITSPGSLLSSAIPTPTTLLTELNPLHTHPVPSPQAQTLVTWIGALIIGITPQLLLAIPNTPSAIAIRRIVYLNMLAGEVALMVLIAWQAVMYDEMVLGMSRQALGFSFANYAFLMLWRVWVFVFKPQWFGDVKFVNDSTAVRKKDE
jgi:hypothetical protein